MFRLPLRPIRAAAVSLVGLGLAAGPAPADAPPPWQAGAPPWAPVTAPPPGESTVVQELDVVKRLPGPALWRVSKGDAQVVILGGLAPLPHLLRWDTTRVENALDGADVLLLPPRTRIGFFGGLGILFGRGALQLPRGRTLDQVLTPDERRRFLAITKDIHKDPKVYRRWKPAVAGVLLLGDFRAAAGLSNAKPVSTVLHLAQARHVPVRYVGEIDLGAYRKTVAGLSDAANHACFDAALDDIEHEASGARALAAAWAAADLNTIGAHYSSSVLERCLLQVPSVESLVERGVAQGVQAIDATLAANKRAVAVIDLNFLLRKNGVLDRLKAQGAELSIPK